MVYEEAVRCGKVLGIAVPVPPPEVPEVEPCRVYIKFSTSQEAAKCKEMMDGRMFDDNKVRRHLHGCPLGTLQIHAGSCRIDCTDLTCCSAVCQVCIGRT